MPRGPDADGHAVGWSSGWPNEWGPAGDGVLSSVIERARDVLNGAMPAPPELPTPHAIADRLARCLFGTEQRCAQIANAWLEYMMPRFEHPAAYVRFMLSRLRAGPMLQVDADNVYLFGVDAMPLARTDLAGIEAVLVDMVTRDAAGAQSAFFAGGCVLSGTRHALWRDFRFDSTLAAYFTWSTFLRHTMRHVMTTHPEHALQADLAHAIDAESRSPATAADANFVPTCIVIVRDMLLSMSVVRCMASCLTVADVCAANATHRHMREWLLPSLCDQMALECCTPRAQTSVMRCLALPADMGTDAAVLAAVAERVAVPLPKHSPLMRNVTLGLLLLYSNGSETSGGAPAFAPSALGPHLRACLIDLPSAAAAFSWEPGIYVPCASIVAAHFILPLLLTPDETHARLTASRHAGERDRTRRRFLAMLQTSFVRGTSDDAVVFHHETGARHALAALASPDQRMVEAHASPAASAESFAASIATHYALYVSHVARVRDACARAPLHMLRAPLAYCAEVADAERWDASSSPPPPIEGEELALCIDAENASPLEVRAAYDAFVAWAGAPSTHADVAMRLLPTSATGSAGAAMIVVTPHAVAWQLASEVMHLAARAPNELAWLAWRAALAPPTDRLRHSLAWLFVLAALASTSESDASWSHDVVTQLVGAWRPLDDDRHVAVCAAPARSITPRADAWCCGLDALGVSSGHVLRRHTARVAVGSDALLAVAAAPLAYGPTSSRPGITPAEDTVAWAVECDVRGMLGMPPGEASFLSNARVGLAPLAYDDGRGLGSSIIAPDLIAHVRKPARRANHATLMADVVQARCRPELAWFVEQL